MLRHIHKEMIGVFQSEWMRLQKHGFLSLDIDGFTSISRYF